MNILGHSPFFCKLNLLGGDDGIRFSRELRAQSFAALTVINCHSLPLLLRILLCLITNSSSSFVIWWRWWDSNPWPPACRAGALPAELHPHFIGFCFSPYFRLWESRSLCSPFVYVSIGLSSRTASREVFSPLQSLTSVFGMGTGGPSAFVTLTFSQ